MENASYNRYSRWLHWLIAGLILFMVFLGWRLDPHDPHALSLFFWHKSIGILILLLSLVRIGVRLAYKAPPEPPMPQWQAWAAKGLHLAFYIVMIGMPLSGWAMVSTSAREIPFFWLHWPHFPGVPIEANMEGPTHETFETIHKLVAKFLIYGMIPLHILAALKHQFVDKDSLFERMVPGLKSKPALNWRWIAPVSVIVLAVGLAEGIYHGGPQKPSEAPAATGSGSVDEVLASASEEEVSSESSSLPVRNWPVENWYVKKSKSRIGFETTFQGEKISGNFKGYTAAIAFDPEQLDKSHVKVTIDLATVASGDTDRDTALKSDSFFDIASQPKAVFEARSFTTKEKGTRPVNYIAHGKLTMHGVTKPLDLPFQLSILDHYAWHTANMSAVTEIDRTAFGIGSGEWAATDAIPAKVKINIELYAASNPNAD